jgi:hypothetical protein
MPAVTATLAQVLQQHVEHDLDCRPLEELASLDFAQQKLREMAAAMAQAFADGWCAVLEKRSRQIAGTCPRCGKARTFRQRAQQPLRVELLGVSLALPKLYVACEHCDAPPCSIVRLLTGLGSGATSLELSLTAAYCAAQHSHGAAQRDLEVHHGQRIERAKLRRMALAIEGEAVRFAEDSRRAALAHLETERRTVGPERLVVEGDGGIVRTATLVPCTAGDAGHGHRTPKRKLLRRKRDTHYREVITLDVRQPGEVEPSALDVVVPATAPAGERARRMLALAARKGLGDNTQPFGLGDMGSALAASFDEAFVGLRGRYWLADWHHTCAYVRNASLVLQRLDVTAWRVALRAAIWHHDAAARDELLERAQAHRLRDLPTHLDKCPLAALQTYLHNNWAHMRYADIAAQNLPVVSARAEAQVRDRTKHRFRVPGAWRVENLEPKATLRAIIAEGRWPHFRAHLLAHQQPRFAEHLRSRLEQAVSKGRLAADCLDFLHGPCKEACAA